MDPKESLTPLAVTIRELLHCKVSPALFSLCSMINQCTVEYIVHVWPLFFVSL